MNKDIIHLYVDPNSAVTLESFVGLHDFQQTGVTIGCRPLQTTPGSKFNQDKNFPYTTSRWPPNPIKRW